MIVAKYWGPPQKLLIFNEHAGENAVTFEALYEFQASKALNPDKDTFPKSVLVKYKEQPDIAYLYNFCPQTSYFSLLDEYSTYFLIFWLDRQQLFLLWYVFPLRSKI